MKRLHSVYPLGQLLIAIFTETRLTLPHFVQAIGYHNVNKGIRAFQSYVSSGLGPTIFLDRLAASPYAPAESALHMTVLQTLEQYDHEWCLDAGIVYQDLTEPFRPFVHATPALAELESLSFFAQSGDFRQYTMTLQAKIGSLPLDTQYKIVGPKIRQNYRQTGGIIGFLGPIQYYLYYHSWSEPPTTFSIDGEPIGIADNATIPRERIRKHTRTFDKNLLTMLLHSRENKPLH